MDYSKLSDFEINCCVGERLGKVVAVYDSKKCNSVGFVPPKGGYIVFHDYCNNPTDAWPVITQHRISLRNRHEGNWKAENEWGVSHFYIDTNPLRAAMIVFLEMQNEQV